MVHLLHLLLTLKTGQHFKKRAARWKHLYQINGSQMSVNSYPLPCLMVHIHSLAVKKQKAAFIRPNSSFMLHIRTAGHRTNFQLWLLRTRAESNTKNEEISVGQNQTLIWQRQNTILQKLSECLHPLLSFFKIRWKSSTIFYSQLAI